MNTSTVHDLSPADTWVDQYGDYLYSYAFYRVSDNSAAEDLVQDAFAAALAARAGFKGKSTEKTWLTSILKNKIMDYFRKRYRGRSVPNDDIDRLVSSTPFFDEKDNWAVKPRKWQQNPQHIHEQSEFMDVLGDCLTTISSKQADTFRLREISQISSEEICKVLDITTSNYWVLMHRARLHIRHCIEKEWFSLETGGGDQ